MTYSKIINKIRELYNSNSDEFIPLHAPVFIGNEKKYLNNCIDSTFVSSVGKFVDEFELKVKLYVIFWLIFLYLISDLSCKSKSISNLSSLTHEKTTTAKTKK